MVRDRNILVAYLLWLPLGIFGAHKLYMRRPMMALLYLLTAGFLLIGWIVDLFTMGEQVEACNEKIYREDHVEDREADLEDYIDELEEQVEELQDRLRRK
ncbi:MAG: TM2 domain-containing protein [Pseudomonadales bacterium]